MESPITGFSLNGKTYTPADPFVIAEVGVNHEGSIENAIALIESAARAGANAVKFQTYKAEKLASKNFSPAYWDTQKESTTSQFELFSKFDSFGPDEYKHLNNVCFENSVLFLSTPFDEDAVRQLSYQPCIKIASADLTNVPLRRLIAREGKPVILSTGAASLDEVSRALDDILAHGAPNVCLMHCVLNYPTISHNANLRRIITLRARFGELASVGYSDHIGDAEIPMIPLLVACDLGASVIEKHFTNDKSLEGNDHYHAMDEGDLRLFTRTLLSRKDLLAGDGGDYLEIQKSARVNARRRIFASERIVPGIPIESGDLIALRSSSGIEIEHWDRVTGQIAVNTIDPGQPLQWSDIRSES